MQDTVHKACKPATTQTLPWVSETVACLSDDATFIEHVLYCDSYNLCAGSRNRMKGSTVESTVYVTRF